MESWARPGQAAVLTRVVLLLVPEPFLRELLAAKLRAAGCYPIPVADVPGAERLTAQLVPDVVLIDLEALTEAEGLRALELVRSERSRRVRLVLLQAAEGDAAAEQAQGLSADLHHADLHITKPVDPHALGSQLLRLLRSRGAKPAAPASSLRLEGIELSREQPLVRVRRGSAWHTLDLPATEHRLLEFLLTEPGRVRSREEIRHAVWRGAPVDLRTVDQYVRRLRQSLQSVGARELVMTVNRSGYRARAS